MRMKRCPYCNKPALIELGFGRYACSHCGHGCSFQVEDERIKAKLSAMLDEMASPDDLERRADALDEIIAVAVEMSAELERHES